MKSGWQKFLVFATLAICLLIWVASYWRSVGIMYNDPRLLIAINKGRIRLEYSNHKNASGWEIVNWPTYDWKAWDDSAFWFLGFTLGNAQGTTHGTFPLWFPSLASSLILGVLFRKSKPARRGFPVDVAKAKRNSTDRV
jgi:hypothetical protein